MASAKTEVTTNGKKKTTGPASWAKAMKRAIKPSTLSGEERTQSYKYQPLKRDEIRLIRLLPPKPDVPNDPIRFKIIHRPLAHYRDIKKSPLSLYEALSYVWGGARTEAVYCDGRKILATPNLVSALSRLRNIPTGIRIGGFHRTLWVDSICINQDDIVERGQQVALMAAIYSSAASVVIWLGEDSIVQRDLHAIAQVRDFYQLSNAAHFDFVRSIAGLWDQAWFSRIWCVQEAVLAPRAIVQAGEVRVDWKQLAAAAQATYQVDTQEMTARQKGRCRAVLCIDRLGDPVMRQQSVEEATDGVEHAKLCPADHLALMEQFRSYSATDPRDKVYGVLGLVPLLRDQGFQAQIEIDYTQSAETVFLDFARIVLKGPEPMRLLRNVNWSRKPSATSLTPSLPSWVPDWSDTREPRPLVDMLTYLWLQDSMWGPADAARILDCPDHGVLKLIGRHFSTIKAIGDVLGDTSSDKALLTWTSWTSLAEMQVAMSPRGFDWYGFDAHVGPLRDPDTRFRNLGTLPSGCITVCTGRRFFVTHSGHAGIVTGGAKVGDEVVYFPGTRIPYAVRHDVVDGDSWLTGECWIDKPKWWALNRCEEREYRLK